MGWQADPTGRAPWRLARDGAWTQWLSDGARTWADPRPVRRRLTPADSAALALVAEVFLPEARAAGALDPAREPALRGVLAGLAAEAAEAAGPVAPAATRPAAVPRPTPTPTPRATPWPQPGAMAPTAAMPRPPAPPVPAPVPSARAEAWRRTTHAVAASLSTHGLAYLGVLLLFVGVFGLVAFAFGDVTPALRPVAEVASAAVPFLAAWWLIRHGAEVVGRALLVMGALLLPVLVITSMVDGYHLPPDPRGTGLVVALTIGCLACAAGYLAWARRHPDAGVHLAVLPTLVLAAAMATIGVGRALPTGQDVAVPTVAQTTAMAGVLALALVAVRRRPEARSGPATLLVVAVLAVLTWLAGDPAAPLVAGTGAALVLALLLLRPLLPPALPDVVAPLAWAVTVLALDLDPALAGVVGVVGFVALTEEAMGRRPLWAVTLPAGGVGLAAAATATDAPLGAATFAALSLWALARWLRPAAGTRPVFEALLAVAPPLAVLELGAATRPTVALGAALGLLAAALPPARAGVAYWRRWWWTGMALVTVAVGPVFAWTVAAGQPGERWVGVAALVALAALVAVGPVPRVARVWSGAALLTLAWLTAAWIAGLDAGWRAGVLAAAGLGLVAVARSRATVVALPVGHAVGLLAVLVAGEAWPGAGALGAGTLGLAVTAARAERPGPVAEGLARRGVPPWVPAALTAAGVPAAVAIGLHAAGTVPLESAWMAAVPASWAVVLAAVVRVLPRHAARVAPWAALAGAVVALPLAHDRWPAVVAWGAVVLLAPLLPAGHRPRVVTWLSWAAVPALAHLLAVAALPAARAEGALTAAVVLVATGLLAVGATVREPGRHWRPARPALRPPHAVGAVALGTGTLLAAATEQPAALAGAALLLAALAALTRLGPFAGAAVVVAWGAALLAWPALVERPWVSTVAAAVVAAGAEASRPWSLRQVTWRWDRALLVAAAPIAVVGLTPEIVPAVWVATGALAVAVAVVLARRGRVLAGEVLAAVGSALALTGAGEAGAGHLAVALAVLAAGHTGIALVTRGQARAVVGAAAGLAAWGAAVVALDLGGQAVVESSLLLAAGLAVVAAVAARAFAGSPVPRAWWGAGLALAVVALAPVLDPGSAATASWVLTGATLGLAAGLALGAAPFGSGGRHGAVVAAVGALLLGLEVGGVPLAVRPAVLAGGAVLAALTTLATGPWRRPAAVGSAAALVAAAALAPADPLVIAPLVAVLAVQAGVAGRVLGSLPFQLLTPVLACTAWLVAAPRLVDGGAPWYTVPVGIALLVVAALLRRDRRPGTPVGPEAATELLGIAFLVGAFVVRAVTESVAQAVVVALLGLLVTGWGVATKVRRRVVAGAAVVLGAAVLLVAVPLVALLPGWGGAGAWLVIAGAGALAVVVATLLERGRAAVTGLWRRLGDPDAGWE